ncbi:MAG: deoxyribonuclease V [Planctomycetota bacterium]
MLHTWDLDIPAAKALQTELAAKVRLEPLRRMPKIVAGADIAFDKPNGRLFAAAVAYRLDPLEMIADVAVCRPIPFPYVPGYLSFREAPAILAAIAALDVTPDAVLIDGQGIAHPRRLGLAAHVGLWLNRPTVGCAKSRLIGEFEEPGSERGAASDLRDGDTRIGTVLRTRLDVRPLFISPGHLVDFEGTVQLTLRCGAGYRLPEPTRQADRLAALAKRGAMARGSGSLLQP